MKNCNVKIVKERNYYLRYVGKPVISIHLILDNKGLFHRGIALCSLKETPAKEIGRNIARDRAILAMNSKGSSDIIAREEAYRFYFLLEEEDLGPTFKSEYNVQDLTDFEKNLFKIDKNNKTFKISNDSGLIDQYNFYDRNKGTYSIELTGLTITECELIQKYAKKVFYDKM